jgi:hypothetical protein
MITCNHYVNALEQKMAFKEAIIKKEQMKDLMIIISRNFGFCNYHLQLKFSCL